MAKMVFCIFLCKNPSHFVPRLLHCRVLLEGKLTVCFLALCYCYCSQVYSIESCRDDNNDSVGGNRWRWQQHNEGCWGEHGRCVWERDGEVNIAMIRSHWTSNPLNPQTHTQRTARTRFSPCLVFTSHIDEDKCLCRICITKPKSNGLCQQSIYWFLSSEFPWLIFDEKPLTWDLRVLQFRRYCCSVSCIFSPYLCIYRHEQWNAESSNFDSHTRWTNIIIAWIISKAFNPHTHSTHTHTMWRFVRVGKGSVWAGRRIECVLAPCVCVRVSVVRVRAMYV